MSASHYYRGDLELRNLLPQSAYPSLNNELKKLEESKKGEVSHEIAKETNMPPEIIHKVREIDSLLGLSLQYSVTIESIKAFNGLESDEIYYLKEIRIPNPKTDYDIDSSIDDEKEAERKKLTYFFMSMMKPKDRTEFKMARYYMEENEFNVEKALKHYEIDCKFEEKSGKSDQAYKKLN